MFIKVIRNKLIGSPFLRPYVPPVWWHGGEKRKERDGVSLAFGIAGPQWEARTARRAISLVIEMKSWMTKKSMYFQIWTTLHYVISASFINFYMTLNLISCVWKFWLQVNLINKHIICLLRINILDF